MFLNVPLILRVFFTILSFKVPGNQSKLSGEINFGIEKKKIGFFTHELRVITTECGENRASTFLCVAQITQKLN